MVDATQGLQVVKMVNLGLFNFFIVLPNVEFDTFAD